MKEYSFDSGKNILWLENNDDESVTFGVPVENDSEEHKKLIESGVEIAPYVEPVKTLEQLQNEAVAAMAAAVIVECRSGTGKLYFSDLNSAARHANELIQPDAEIRTRATQLLQWDVAIDAYALEVVFSIEQGGAVPTLESFIAGLPKI